MLLLANGKRRTDSANFRSLFEEFDWAVWGRMLVKFNGNFFSPNAVHGEKVW
jgi:hypothetical protein